MRVCVTRIGLLSLSLVFGVSCSGLPHIVVSSDPLTPAEHVQLGAILDEEGLTEEARHQFHVARSQKADHPSALIGLGNLSFKEADYARAEDFYTRALKAAPMHPSAANNLALVYLQQAGKVEEAEKLAIQALAQSGPFRPHILHTLAEIYIRQGRFHEAKTCLDQAFDLAPQTQVALREEITKSRARLP
jgi:tetratricopeptide (TPR) repeat protein